MVSARFLGDGPLRISWMVQKLVWLKRRVNATTLGATTYLSFLVQAQLDSSSGWMATNEGRSSSVIWPARSSGAMRSALSVSASRSLIDEFSGRLCVLCECADGESGGVALDRLL